MWHIQQQARKCALFQSCSATFLQVFIELLCLCHAHSVLCSTSASRSVGQFFEAPRKSVQLIVNIICSSIVLFTNSLHYPSSSLHLCLSIFCVWLSSFSVGHLENSTRRTPSGFSMDLSYSAAPLCCGSTPFGVPRKDEGSSLISLVCVSC